MKKTKLIFLLFFSLLTIAIGCKEDDLVKVDSTPEFQSLVQAVSSLAGQTVTFTGVVSDPAGIKSINMKYEAWFLDKTIAPEALPTSYEISYKFKVPADAVLNSVHTIPITIVNSGGVSITKNVVVTLNQDIAKPVVQIAKPIDGATAVIGAGKEVEFSVTVTDAKLAEFKIESSVLTETIPISGTTYTYTKTLDIDKTGVYVFKISAKDVSGNSTTNTVTVNVVNQLLFDVMYITDVETNSLLGSDMFGVPYNTVASTVPAEKGYVFTARYYASKPNSKVRFLPQKGSFEPYTFGADPSGAGKLALGGNVSVDPIVLPQVGYYVIKIDLRNRSFTATPYTPTDATYPQVYIIGTGIFLSNSSTCTSNANGSLLCWNFASGKPFVKDANNPHLWTIDVRIDDEPNNTGVNGFILNSNPAGWNPFWRMNADDFSVAILNGGTNVVFPAESLGKNYTIRFDTHLNAISAVLR